MSAQQLEMSMRQEKVVDWILRRIRKPLMKAMWRREFQNANGQPMCDTTFIRDYNAALQMIYDAKDGQTVLQRTQVAVAAREEIIRLAHEQDKLQLALSAEKDLAELEGLYKQKEGAGTTFVLDFGGLPEAPSDDGPVPKEMLDAYDAKEDED